MDPPRSLLEPLEPDLSLSNRDVLVATCLAFGETALHGIAAT